MYMARPKKVNKVSELITKEEVLSWTNDKLYYINAGTGMGKSYFIKNTLYEVAKEEGSKILFLIHRTNCVNQFTEEIIKDGKTDVIDIRTYQSLEFYNRKDIELPFTIDIKSYKYIVCDEAHYFLSDGKFNKFVDISLNNILNTNAIKIFMSATGSKIEHYLGSKKYLGYDIEKYSIPIEFKFIDQILEYKTKEDLIYSLDYNLKCKKNKIIIFCKSAKEAYEYHMEFEKDSLFLCSKNNKLYRHVDEDKISEMLKNEKFECRYLFTTACLDAGVNIVDSKVDTIVIDGLTDIDQIIQCIGRKRFTERHQKLGLAFRKLDKRSINGSITNVNKILKIGDEFLELGIKDFVDKYGRNFDNSEFAIVYGDYENSENSYKLNELCYFSHLSYLESLEEMRDLGYIRYICNKLNFNDKVVKLMGGKKESKVKEFIEDNLGLPLDKEKQKELIELCDVRIERRLKTSIGHINMHLIEEYGYTVTSSKIRVKGKLTTVWIIDKID